MWEGAAVIRRTPLRRKTPLQRGGGIRQGPAKRRGPSMAMGKSKRVVDQAYLAWCRYQPCAFCGVHGVFPVEAHHVDKRKMGGAVQRDDRAVPACRICHRRCHGERVQVRGEAHPRPVIYMNRQIATAKRCRAYYEAKIKRAIPW